MKKTMRSLLLAAALAASGTSFAQSYPVKPVRLLTVLTAGADTWIRVMAGRLADNNGQPFIVENRPGASGVIAVQAVTGAAPDGHTLLVHGAPYLISKAIQPNLAMDPANELAPVVKVYGSGPIGVVVSGASPSANVEDLVARLKASPGKLTFGSAGLGLIHHFAGELFLTATQTQALHIPFKGPDLYTALMRGDIDFTVSPMTVIMPLVKAGKMRLLATMNAGRHSALPDVRTLNELYKNELVVMEFWAGLAAPVKTPAPIIRAIHAATVRALDDPAVRNAIEVGLNVPTPAESVEAFTAFVRRENDKAREIVKLTGIKGE
ncbi:MAG: Bug family tripartite tricarboxylate transporter substrate binding protein [Burkholderiales bacterium]